MVAHQHCSHGTSKRDCSSDKQSATTFIDQSTNTSQRHTTRFGLSICLGPISVFTSSSNASVLRLEREPFGPSVGLSSQPKFGLSQPCSTFFVFGFVFGFGFGFVRECAREVEDECGFVDCFLCPMHTPSHEKRLKLWADVFSRA